MIVGPDGKPLVKVPESLKEGFERFMDWAKSRALSEYPLPPGGYFIMSKFRIIREEFIRYRHALLAELELPAECVIVEPEFDDRGRMTPQTTVNPPPEWIAMRGGGKVALSYINGAIRRLWEDAKVALTRRRREFEQAHRRPDLLPTEIIDALEEAEDQEVATF